MLHQQAAVTGTRWSRIGHRLSTGLAGLRASPATWCFGLVWALAAATLVLLGQTEVALRGLAVLVGVAVFGLLTLRLTSAAAGEGLVEPGASRRRLWMQVVVLGLVIAFTAYRGFAFRASASDVLRELPVLFPLATALDRLAFQLIGTNPNLLVNPLLYVGLPLAAVLALGARRRALGLVWGRRSWTVALLWSLPSLAIIAVNLATGQMSLGRLGARLVSNSLQNGFFEEFLFRGALMTRLMTLLGSGWGMVLSSLVFGLWHIGAQTQQLGGNMLAGAAASIVLQATAGLGLAVMVQRTGSLLPSSIHHVLGNSSGG